MVIRIYYATDIHGSDICWKKFINAGNFYRADVLILGGDMTGKAVIPIIEKGAQYEASFEGRKWVVSKDKVHELEQIINNKGYYAYYTTIEGVEELNSDVKKRDEIFIKLMTQKLRKWIEIADERLENTNTKCFVCPGNDDIPEIDSIIEESKNIIHAGEKVVEISECHEMLSLGWVNPSPWKTFKECTEEELCRKIDNLVSHVRNIDTCIFNLHAPPYGTGLDSAPQIDKTLKSNPRLLMPVGSISVLNAIKKYQPLLGLHGHIHEAKAFVKIGRSLCINPGSSYDRGVLLGTIINVDKEKVKSYMPVMG
ncbi:MAG: metallophosphoesterase [Candidatus Bathyarchaeia archaeon]